MCKCKERSDTPQPIPAHPSPPHRVRKRAKFANNTRTNKDRGPTTVHIQYLAEARPCLQLLESICLVKLQLPNCPLHCSTFPFKEHSDVEGTPTSQDCIAIWGPFQHEHRENFFWRLDMTDVTVTEVTPPFAWISKGGLSQTRTGSLKVGCSLMVTESNSSVSPRT